MRRWRSTRDRWSELLCSGSGPWSARQLTALGWTRAQIAAAVSEGVLNRVRYGLYVAESIDPPAIDAQVLSALTDQAVLSHQSAAQVHGLWVPRRDGLVHVTVPGEAERRDSGLRIHGSRLPESMVLTVGGLRVTSPARTAVDLARGRSLEDAVVAVDGAAVHLVGGEDRRAQIRAGALDASRLDRARADLWAAYRTVWSWPGTRVVRQALELVDIRSESPAESRSRVWALDAGLPAPEVGGEVVGASGRHYFGDLVWREQGVIGEVDGLGKYGVTADEVRRALADERARQADLEDAGWRFVRWTARDHRIHVQQRVARALRGASGVE